MYQIVCHIDQGVNIFLKVRFFKLQLNRGMDCDYCQGIRPDHIRVRKRVHRGLPSR